MSKLSRLFIAAMLVISVSGVQQAHAGKPGQRSAQPLTGADNYVWYDGQRKKTVWLNPELIAEFDPKPAGHSQTKSLVTNAVRANGRQPALQLWRLKAGVSNASALRQIRQASPGSKVSPVLHDGPSGAARKRALPGNIIVHLDPDWDSQAVKAWFSEQNLELVRPLNIGPNIFIVKTGPGLEALEKANAIYLSGKVVAAYPDWWQEAVKR